jgi:hypothetical protein
MPTQAPAVRADGSAPIVGRPSPAATMPFLRAGRPLKAWRYVGLYAEDVMLCVGRVRVAGVPQSFWAVWDREAGVLHERTSFLPGQVTLPDGCAHVRARGVEIDLRVDGAGDAVDVRSPHGAAWIWTRKTPVTVSGTVRVGGRTRQVHGAGLVDDSAGHHARDTAWEWSAGTGTLTDGRSVTWNLVTGVHDGPVVSERSVWVDGRVHAVGPVTFTPALDGVAFAEGGALAFSPEAVRERHDALGPVRSDYVQPFGTFTGSLPAAGGALTLATGFGVMERHRARW